MPFVNSAQERLCVSKTIDSIARGEKPADNGWNCVKYACEDPSSKDCRDLKNTSVLYEGKRGGLYFYTGDRKVYVPARDKEGMKKAFGVEKRKVNLNRGVPHPRASKAKKGSRASKAKKGYRASKAKKPSKASRASKGRKSRK